MVEHLIVEHVMLIVVWRNEHLHLFVRIVTARVLGRMINDGSLDLVSRCLGVTVSQVTFAVCLGRERIIAQRAFVGPVSVMGSVKIQIQSQTFDAFTLPANN